MFKRLVVALLTIAMLTPTVSIAAPYAYGTSLFRDMYFKYDAKRGVFLDTAAASDNICRLMQFEAWHQRGEDYSYKHPCMRPVVVPAIKLIFPQSAYNTTTAKSLSSSAAARKPAKAKKVELSNGTIASVATAVADAVSVPGAFIRGGLAFDREGNSADVFSSVAVARDALGWILKKSCDELRLDTAKTEHRQVAERISVLVNTEVVRATGRTLVAINDEDGRDAVVTALLRVAEVFKSRGNDVVVKEKSESGKWATRSELSFLRMLKEKNPAAFEAYRDTFFSRTEWGDLDPDEIAKFLGVSPDETA